MSTENDFIHERSRGEVAAGLLRSTVAVRERCTQLLDRARVGQSAWFTVDESRLREAAGEVATITRRRYPKLHIPFHSRWRHFEAGGVDRRKHLEERLGHVAPQTRVHAMVDLTVVSVLLDAGAGPDWKYTDPIDGRTYTRSEGLAVASFHAFTAGMFSSDKLRPLQADAQGLRSLATDRLAQAFQVSESNPLVGLEGRAVLLRRLGEAMAEQPEVFTEVARPSGLCDLLVGDEGGITHTAEVQAHDLLSQILVSLSGIWPMGTSIGGVPLGDVWRHAAVRGDGPSDGWVPFHKLSQWLTYSLLEPLQWAGVKVRGIDKLTALPEYRNGGLLIDSGVITLREPATVHQVWHPGDEIIVEWRALTVALLDELAGAVRRELSQDEEHLPLACVLEGGTWAAGREMAQRTRGGLPPLQVHSDGTVF
ncbi:URC4/urg3 family protein [Ramlibacter sp. Leaf400]|uniref:URC4/urg3 family protein n=1 Tax=Ramlibacter sp. Leaf400 TaxID=1736365 RepID=UPI0006FDFE4F|nr:URC4/urg3 family protein [Ramlibacter sp. Leaf400]KQT10694.1 uracil phosphoribosyltransferase [Ramlibacter sp. Leaf400]